MKPHFLIRISGLLVLLTFTYSCTAPYVFTPPQDKPHDVTPEGKPFDPLNPGEGTPIYAYIDNDGNISDVDCGITVLSVDNNKHAEGAFIYSNDTEDDYRSVTFLYENTTVTMFFEDNSHFPTRMNAYDQTESFSGYFSIYNSETQTFNVIFEQENSYNMANNVFLEKELLSKYEYDPELTPSQNKRMHNLAVASAVYFSLYNFYESENISASFARGAIANWFKNFFKIVAVVVLVVIIVIFPPAIIIINGISGLATPLPPPKLPSPPPPPPPPEPGQEPEPDKRVIIEVKWPDDRKSDSITSPKDWLHLRKNDDPDNNDEYTIRVEVYNNGNWNKEKFESLKTATYHAYSPEAQKKVAEVNNRPSYLDYFLGDDGYPYNPYDCCGSPYKIIEDPDSERIFYIKFQRDSGAANNAELRIGFIFDNPLVINPNSMNLDDIEDVVFYGNIDVSPDYSPIGHSHENIHYNNVLTARFCLSDKEDYCTHFQ